MGELSRPVGAALTAADIQAHVQALAAALPRLRTERELTAGSEVAFRFQRLRSAYQLGPKAFEPFIAELTRLRRDCDQVLNTRLVHAVDRFQDLTTLIRAAEIEKDFLREFFIRKAAEGPQRFTGRTADVHVKTSPTRNLPASSSPERVQLEKLLQQSGAWADVSQLSRPRLCKAIIDGQLGPAQADVERLCPAAVTHVVSARAR